MELGKKRSRCANFNALEDRVLVAGVTAVYDKLYGKVTPDNTFKQKEQLWAGITAEVNA